MDQLPSAGLALADLFMDEPLPNPFQETEDFYNQLPVPAPPPPLLVTQEAEQSKMEVDDVMHGAEEEHDADLFGSDDE